MEYLFPKSIWRQGSPGEQPQLHLLGELELGPPSHDLYLTFYQAQIFIPRGPYLVIFYKQPL